MASGSGATFPAGKISGGDMRLAGAVNVPLWAGRLGQYITGRVEEGLRGRAVGVG